MKGLYSDSQSKTMDNSCQVTFGIPGEILMEDASFSSYNLIKSHLASARDALFVAGLGNNGGDCLALARLAYLNGFRNFRVLLVPGERESQLRALQREICEKLGIAFCSCDSGFGKPDLIIDGLFGIGLKGEVREAFRPLIDAINCCNAKVISLDVPSGMGSDTLFASTSSSVKADMTICMGELKKSLFSPKNRDFAGEIVCSFPLFADSAKPQCSSFLLEQSDLALKPLAKSAYKKSRKSVAIVGGSSRYTGAVVLAAKAAFHAGVGLVTIFTESALVPVISKAIPSAMVSTYDEISLLEAFDAVLLGPGMGKNHDDVLSCALKTAKRLVIDADGIRAMARLKVKASENCIITPHLGEYSALLEAFGFAMPDTPSQWEETLVSLQKALGCTIVVKANTVWICSSSGKVFVYDGQNPSLGVAGSGDVLAGITCALFANAESESESLCAESCACNATILHQGAGKAANAELGFYSSDDLIRFIGK